MTKADITSQLVRELARRGIKPDEQAVSNDGITGRVRVQPVDPDPFPGIYLDRDGSLFGPYNATDLRGANDGDGPEGGAGLDSASD